ncbi:MAG: PaaI family thioesterase [Rhodoglobus sp.]
METPREPRIAADKRADKDDDAIKETDHAFHTLVTDAPLGPRMNPFEDEPVTDPAGSRERARAVASRLGEAARAFNEAVVTSRADPEDIADVTRSIIELTERLRIPEPRSMLEPSEIEDHTRIHPLLSSVSGLAHPASVPLTSTLDSEGALHARGRLGARFEGPPGKLHGGWVCAVFDEVLGALASIEHRILTARLEVDFLAPVPLDSEILVVARIDRVEGRKVYLTAEMSCVDAPEDITSRARALMVRPRPGQAEEYFGELAAVPRTGHPGAAVARG